MSETQSAARVDAAAVVAEIEAEVARRRAAGEYPGELLRTLAVEFNEVVDEDASLVEMAHIETVRPLRSSRRGLSSAVIFAKRVLRRGMAWYVRPLADDQSRFNFAVLQELRTLRDRVDRLDSAWQRPAESPPREAGAASLPLTAARLVLLDTALRDLPPGPVLLLWWADDALLTGLVSRGLAVETATLDPAMAQAGRTTGVRVHDEDPLRLLGEVGPTMAAVVAPGLLPMLTPTETLQLLPLAAAALRDGGRLVLDCPEPSSGDPTVIDAGFRRWVSPDTVTLLCEAAGLRDVSVQRLDASLAWYAVSARRQA